MTEAKRYRPSNGTTGMSFVEHWCGRCKRDEAFQKDEGDSCPIVAAAFAFGIDEPGYPREWIYGANGPCCTAFEEIDSPEKQDANAAVRDLFGERT